MQELKQIPREEAKKEFSLEERILMNTCSKLAVYTKKCDWAGLKEVEDLLSGMQRSVIYIQRRKKNILEKKNRKLNMLAANTKKYGHSGNKHSGGKNKHSVGKR